VIVGDIDQYLRHYWKGTGEAVDSRVVDQR
jgi:hypothetical protein